MLYIRGPLFFPDSATYVEAAPNRSPLYPLLIMLLKAIFTSSFPNAIVIIQLILGFISVLVCGRILWRLMPSSAWMLGLILATLAAPYFNPGWGVGNAILTEGMAYPLFLLSSVWLISGLVQQRTRAMLAGLVFAVLLVLTRKQFLFMWPAFAIGIAGLHFHSRQWKRTAALTGALIFAIIFASVVERGWNYCWHDRFVPLPFTGVQLIVAPLMHAAPGDVVAMATPRQGEFFQTAIEEATRQRLTLSSVPVDDQLFHKQLFLIYLINYNPLLTVVKLKSEATFGAELNDGMDKLIAADRGTIDTAITLIRANPTAFLRHYTANVLNGIGGNSQVGLSFVILQLLAGSIALLIFFRQQSTLAIAVLIALMLHFGNAMAVALVEPTLARYMFYTGSLLTVTLLIVFSRGLTAPER